MTLQVLLEPERDRSDDGEESEPEQPGHDTVDDVGLVQPPASVHDGADPRSG